MDRNDDVDDDVSLSSSSSNNSQFWFPRSRTTRDDDSFDFACAFEKVCKDIAAFSSAYLACNRANRIAVVSATREECVLFGRTWKVMFSRAKKKKTRMCTKKKKLKKRKPPTNPRMTFVGDDEYDDIGGFATMSKTTL